MSESARLSVLYTDVQNRPIKMECTKLKKNKPGSKKPSNTGVKGYRIENDKRVPLQEYTLLMTEHSCVIKQKRLD